MTHEFLGQQFDSAKEWEKAFPAFGRHYWKYVVAGAKTPTEVEVMARKSNQSGAARSRAGGKAMKLRRVV